MRTEWGILCFHYFHLSFHWYLHFWGDIYIPLFFFYLPILFIGWMVHVHSIKFLFPIMFGTPPPIVAISRILLLWFIDRTGLKVFHSLNITLVGVPYLSFGVDIGYGYFYSLEYLKDRSFFIWLWLTSFKCKSFVILGVFLSPLFCCCRIIVIISIINDEVCW